MKVVLRGHANTYGISDVLRLFCTKVKEDKDKKEVIAEDGPDIILISEVYEGKAYTYREGESRPLSEDRYDLDPKRAVKRSFYVYMRELMSVSYPWGCLTGIRPTVVAEEEGFDEKSLSAKYLVREDKAKLACITGANERRILEGISKDDMGLYIGIPFCPSRCEYCSFISADATKHLGMLDKYEEALERELQYISDNISRKISMVYIGGGTPTVLSDKTFERLLGKVMSTLKMIPDTEFTVEAGRPDTITSYKLRAMKEAGVGRICINPQTMRSETLSRLNRRHTSEDAVKVFEEARSLGFDVINMDLIAGLKYERDEDFLYSVQRLLELRPENITIHTLYKKRRAAMEKDEVLDRDLTRGSVDTALTKGYEMLFESGYIPYYLYRQKDTGHGLENTGFALPGKECRYNVAMMTDRRDVISVGAGGMSKRIFDGDRYERCPCTKDPHEYIRDPLRFASKKVRFFH